jgi:tetratricopeptide (TPR) repeat protein
MVRAKDLSFYRWNLKSGGKIRKAGWVFLILAELWIGLNIHTGWVHYHESAGTRAYESIGIPDELALARAKPAKWLTAGDNQNIAAGKKHLYSAFDGGLFVNTVALPKLAWMEYLSGNAEQAVKLLGIAETRQSGQARALSLYYHGAMLNRLARYEQALAVLDQAIAERPDLVLAREEQGDSLWMLGRREEAVAAWEEVVKQNPEIGLASYLLAGASALKGDTQAAADYKKRADASTPKDPLFYWMLGLRLQNVGMNDLADKNFQKAIEINPQFQKAR